MPDWQNLRDWADKHQMKLVWGFGAGILAVAIVADMPRFTAPPAPESCDVKLRDKLAGLKDSPVSSEDQTSAWAGDILNALENPGQPIEAEAASKLGFYIKDGTIQSLIGQECMAAAQETFDKIPVVTLPKSKKFASPVNATGRFVPVWRAGLSL